MIVPTSSVLIVTTKRAVRVPGIIFNRACHGPTLLGRPGPSNCRGWAAARPSPSHLQKVTARPGPSLFPKSRPGPARPGPSHGTEVHETRGLYMDRPDPTITWAGPCVVPYYGVHVHTLTCFFKVIVGSSCFFFPSGFVVQLLSAHETHITTTWYLVLTTSTHTILLHHRLGRMASCGPPPPRAAATPAAATAAARAAATTGAAAIHAAVTPSIQQR